MASPSSVSKVCVFGLFDKQSLGWSETFPRGFVLISSSHVTRDIEHFSPAWWAFGVYSLEKWPLSWCNHFYPPPPFCGVVWIRFLLWKSLPRQIVYNDLLPFCGVVSSLLLPWFFSLIASYFPVGSVEYVFEIGLKKNLVPIHVLMWLYTCFFILSF